MAQIRLRDARGTVIEVPDELTTKGGKQDWVLNNIPGVTNEMVGLAPGQKPELQTGSAAERFLFGSDPANKAGAMELARTVLDFGFGDDPGTEGLAAVREQHPVATTVGGAVPHFAAGGLVSRIPTLAAGLRGALAQGGTAAALETARTNDPERIATAGALGVGGQFGGEITGRVLSGVARGLNDRIARPLLRQVPRVVEMSQDLKGTFLQGLSQMARGGGGLNFAVRQNTRAIHHAAAKALGFSDEAARAVDDLDEEFLLTARGHVNARYGAAEPTEAVSLQGARAALDDVPDQASPLINDIRASLDDQVTLPAERWQPIQRSLREAAAELRGNQNWGQWSRRVDEAIDALDDAAANAGGDRALLGQANQQYKVLATLEEINAVVEEGVLPAGELIRKLGRDNFKGFGRRSLAEGAPRLTPEIQNLMQVGKDIARFNRQTAGGSATAGRQAVTGPLGGAFKGIVTGNLSPGQAVSIASGGTLPSLIGRAAVGGDRLARAGVAGAAAATQAGRSKEPPADAEE